MESIGSKLINELGSGDVGFVVDLKFLVNLELCFHCLLMVGISEFQLVLSAVIWHVLDEADFAVVDATLHEIEIVDSPSWLGIWEFCGKRREVGLALLLALSRAFCALEELDTRIFSLWNSENSPPEFAGTK